MSSLSKLVATETRLFVRDPTSLFIGLLLPAGVLLGLGAIPVLREVSPDLDGLRFIDYYAPSLLVMAVAVTGITTFPAIMATYRERGVLRRMKTTPVHPAKLLLAQLIVNLAAALAAAALLIVAGRVVYDLPLPGHPVGFTVAFVIGIASIFALGMLVAALAPTARTATGVSMVMFMTIMLVGGVYLPRFFLPDVIADLGDYVPPGVQTLLDTWNGSAPSLAPLLVMSVTAVVAGAISARVFRWE